MQYVGIYFIKLKFLRKEKQTTTLEGRNFFYKIFDILKIPISLT